MRLLNKLSVFGITRIDIYLYDGLIPLTRSHDKSMTRTWRWWDVLGRRSYLGLLGGLLGGLSLTARTFVELSTDLVNKDLNYN